jgi:hypothetical protein
MASRSRCLWLLPGIALCGCAAVIVPTQVRFPSLKAGPDAVQMVDVRPRTAREYREEGEGPKFKFFADDAMQPNAVGLIASRIAASLPAAQRDRPVELRRLDVGFLLSSRPLWPGSSNTSLSTQSGAPGAAIAAGLLLAYGMIAAIHTPRTDESAVAYIEVAIGADSLRAAQTVAVGRSVGAAETAFRSALDDLAEQARALSPRASAAP